LLSFQNGKIEWPTTSLFQQCSCHAHYRLARWHVKLLSFSDICPCERASDIIFKKFQYGEKSFFNIYFSSWFFWLLGGKNFAKKKKLNAKLEIRKKNWSKTKGLKKKFNFLS